MPEREMNPNVGNARRFRIAAEAGETAVEINLPVTLPRNRQPNHYKIVKKDIPDAAKGKTYGRINGKPAEVIWINNFGIRLRGNFGVRGGGNKQDPFIEEVDGEQFEYEVIVPGPAPEGYPTLVYFDGTDVQPAGATTDSEGNYHFNLDIGDPAAGWGG
jgi:hypothetical protein